MARWSNRRSVLSLAPAKQIRGSAILGMKTGRGRSLGMGSNRWAVVVSTLSSSSVDGGSGNTGRAKTRYVPSHCEGICSSPARCAHESDPVNGPEGPRPLHFCAGLVVAIAYWYLSLASCAIRPRFLGIIVRSTFISPLIPTAVTLPFTSMALGFNFPTA
jgi:hypothetical protein